MLTVTTRARNTMNIPTIGVQKTTNPIYVGHDSAYLRPDVEYVFFYKPVIVANYVRNIMGVDQDHDFIRINTDIFANDRYIFVYSTPKPNAIFDVNVENSDSHQFVVDTETNTIYAPNRTYYSAPIVKNTFVHFHTTKLNDHVAVFMRAKGCLLTTWFNPEAETLVNPYHFYCPQLLSDVQVTLATVHPDLQSYVSFTKIENDMPKLLLIRREDGNIYTHDGTNFVQVTDTVTVSNFDTYAFPFTRYLNIANQITPELGSGIFGAISNGFAFPVSIKPSFFIDNIPTSNFLLTLRKEQRTVFKLGEL